MRVLEQQLRERIGLDAATLGPSIIERTVRLRMKSLRLEGVPDYRALLQRSPAEWKELIESVVVAETWFFRDREPFTALTRLVLTQGWSAHLAAPLRLLSLPCSTGEEPYSLAITLLDAGLPPNRFRIDAVDISERALAAARRAIYGRNSFRSEDLSFRARHFHPMKEGYALEPGVRECVNFSHGNLLDDGSLPSHVPYDFIFCRNLLIYFDRPTQTRALQKLECLLHDQGFLFVGPAELPFVINSGFVSAGLPLAFACRKARAEGSPPPRPPARTNLRAASPSLPPDAASVPPNRFRPRTPPLPRDARNEDDSLHAARRLADAGQLNEATALCEGSLRKTGASAQAYYLLGLIADAQGLASAAEHYRKALYLDPDHYEALMQFSLLSARQGDAARARVFRRRAERVLNHR